MKKVKLNKKLNLNKETVTNLNMIFGGGDNKATFSLWSCDPSNKPKSCCQTGCADTCPNWSKPGVITCQQTRCIRC
ncbi:MAG TPA: class I lanthipeptide [Bacteroidales bacterium]|nr:class I lanthipeptide [Bacteroidales bacterium]HPS18030.1 class I lanthipeptide [Bacteroidales bacterium]